MSSLPQAVKDEVCLNLFTMMGTHTIQDKSFWESLHEQLKEGYFSDVIIKCKGITFQAHKCILSAVSKYFKVLFTSPLGADKSHHIANFNDMFKAETVALSLSIIYHHREDKCAMKEIDVIEMLKFAEFIQCDWLLDVLVDAIRCVIDKTNALTWYEVGREGRAEKLISLAYSFIRDTSSHSSTSLSNDMDSRNMYDKEVVLLRNLEDNSYDVFDNDKKTFEKYDNGFLSAFERGKMRAVRSLFLHKNDVYMVSDLVHNKSTVLTIEKYNYIHQAYKFVKNIFLETIPPKAYRDEVISAYDVTYDQSNNLYIVIECFSVYLVFKFDLDKSLLCKNYMVLTPDNTIRILESKQIGSLIYRDLRTIYNLNNFKWNSVLAGVENHEPIKLNILSSFITKKHNKNNNNKNNNNNKTKSKTDITTFFAWDPISFNGNIYGFVEPGEHSLSILFLDVVSGSWLPICNFPLYSDSICTFSCQGKLFMLFQNGCKCIDNRDKLETVSEDEFISCLCDDDYNGSNTLFHFDTENMSMKNMGIKLDANNGWEEAFHLPFHILL